MKRKGAVLTARNWIAFMNSNWFILPILGSLLIQCENEVQFFPETTEIAISNYKTQYVIIVVIDGPRMSETWASPNRSLIPNQAILANQGALYANFFNEGITRTVPGLTAISTGHYQEIENNGMQFPKYPSLFQVWLGTKKENPVKAPIFTTKSKLSVLSDCNLKQWRSRFNPYIDPAYDQRTDSETLEVSINHIRQFKPSLVLIHFKSPDSYGHGNQWDAYLESIGETDRLVMELWNYLQDDPFYKDQTTLFVTYDHGRHLDQVKDGFVSHGDYCLGCSHISLLAIGPDFHSDTVFILKRSLIDIAPTVAELMAFEMPFSDGDIMQELFKAK